MDTVSDDTRNVFYRPATRIGTTIAGLVLVTGGTGGIWVSDYVENRLSPAIAQDLSQSLNRPVELGSATSFSPTHIRFGSSTIPPTEDDADSVDVDAVIVRFSLMNLWRDGEVPLSVTLVRPDIYLDQNEGGAWLDTDMDVEGNSKFSVQTVRLRDADIQISPDREAFEVHPKAIQYLSRRSEFENPSAPGENLRDDEVLKEEFASNPTVQVEGVYATLKRNQADTVLSFTGHHRGIEGGNVRIEGQVTGEKGQLEATIHAQQLAIAPFAPLLPSALFVKEGQVTGQVSILSRTDQPIAFHGSAKLENVTAWAKGEPNPFTKTHAQLTFDNQTIQVDDAAVTYGWIPFEAEGRIHLKEGIQLQAQAQAVDAHDFMATFDLAVPVPVMGSLQTENLTVTGKFGQTVFSGTVTHDQQLVLDQVAFDAVSTDFTLDKQTDILTLTHSIFEPVTGGQIVGNARIRLGDTDDAVITAQAEGISADAIAHLYGLALDDNQLGQFSANTQLVLTEQGLQTQLAWGLTEGDYPASGMMTTRDDHLVLRDTTIHVGQNVVTATGELTKSRWRTTFNTEGMSLASLTPNSTGILAGEVTLLGTLDDLRLAALRAEGTVSVSEIHPVLTEPLHVDFDWRGDRLHIQQAKSSGLEADGWIQPSFTGQSPDITDMAIDVRVQEMNLEDIAARMPQALPMPVGGRTQFAGRLTGSLDAPQLDGRLQLTDFALGAIAFAPVLEGRIQLEPNHTLHLALSGEQDAIQLQGTPSAVDFNLQRGDAIAQGQFIDRQLTATLQALPLGFFHEMQGFNPEATPLLSALQGHLSADIQADWRDAQNPSLVAKLAIANPILGTLPRRFRRGHRGDRLTGTVRYQNGIAQISDGHLRFGESRIRLSGQASDEQVYGQIDIERAALRDVVTLIRAASTDADVSSTLMAYANQANASGENDQASSPEPSPELSFDIAALMDTPQQVHGTLAGSIGVQFHPHTQTLQAEVGLRGQQWQVGPFGVDQFRLDNGQLSPTSMAVANVQLTGLSYGDLHAPEMLLRASIDSAQQTGRLQLTQVPLGAISQWIESPVHVGGEFGAIAHWRQTGTLPNMTGSFLFDNLSIGTFATETINIGFNVENDTLQLGQWLIPGHPTELITIGRIPFRLPYMERLPDAPVRFVSQADPIEIQRTSRRSSQDWSVNGADKVVVSLGLFQKSFGIRELETLVESGDVPNGWGIYLDLANLDVTDIQTTLTQEIALDLVLTDHLLNSLLGEQLLNIFGQVVHPPSGHASVQALRSALVFATYDDGRVSLLEFLKNYPHDEIHVNLDELSEVMKSLEQQQES